VTRYEDVVTVLKDPHFSNQFGAGLRRNPFASSWTPRLVRVFQTSMLRVDDPDHARLRKLVQLAFTPRRVQLLATQVEGVLFTVLGAPGFTFLVSLTSLISSLPATENIRQSGHNVGKLRGAEHGKQYTAWVLLAIEGSSIVWVRHQDLEDVVDVATPVPTEQPIVIANEQRAAPTALAATVAPATPAGAPPAPPPTVPRTIVYRNVDGSIFATYTCQPYGDWRDSDPMYVHPECSQ
jgi:hypothetical protein